VLGGAVTACTGLVTEHWGPVIGGLFFPAILPASVTLIERHESEKKLSAGIDDRVRGRKTAALDAAGAVLGGWGSGPRNGMREGFELVLRILGGCHSCGGAAGVAAARTRVDAGELGAEVENHCRVVDPENDHDEGTGRTISGRHRGLP
jgi:hypothetical protein